MKTVKADENGKRVETAAYKAGFKTIFDVGLARVSGAIKQLTLASPSIDRGFKVFRLSNSNIRAWNPDSYNIDESLLSHEEHLIDQGKLVH